MPVTERRVIGIHTVRVLKFWIESALENARFCQEMQEVVVTRMLKVCSSGATSRREKLALTEAFSSLAWGKEG